MAEKLKMAAQYKFCLTIITASKPTHVTAVELLDDSLGNLESSVHMNFIVDLGWLMAKYFFSGYED